MSLNDQSSYHKYLKDGGEMGQLTRDFDWSKTNLGPPEQWSSSLLTTVGIILKSKFPMFLWWGTDLIQFYNDAYRPSLGNNGKHPGALGQQGVDCWPEIWPVIKPLIDQVMSGGASTWNEDALIPIYRNNKLEDVYWTFSYSKVEDTEDKPGGVLVICSETTEEILSKKKMGQAEEMLRFSIEAANAGTWIVDIASRKFRCSVRLKQLYGYRPDEEMSLEDLITNAAEDHREKVALAVEETIINHKPFNISYPVIGHHDQKTRWVNAFGRAYKDSTNNLMQFSALVIEITEQKLDEIRKNDFIGIVSHELKTPLTSLNAYIQMLTGKLKTNEDVFITGALDKAHRQVKKMSTMVNGFLNISRLESGKIYLQKETFSLDELINALIEETALTGIKYPIIYTPTAPIAIFADREKIGSVISNLLSNAVKYASKENHITISAEVMTNAVQVSIKDEGMGIKPQDMEKLFDRFYRVEGDYTHNISGFGIGLYLCAEIIKKHNGEIWVESQSDIGSTFFFTLPLQPFS